MGQTRYIYILATRYAIAYAVHITVSVYGDINSMQCLLWANTLAFFLEDRDPFNLTCHTVVELY